jgi:hypothetical protein
MTAQPLLLGEQEPERTDGDIVLGEHASERADISVHLGRRPAIGELSYFGLGRRVPVEPARP